MKTEQKIDGRKKKRSHDFLFRWIVAPRLLALTSVRVSCQVSIVPHRTCQTCSLMLSIVLFLFLRPDVLGERALFIVVVEARVRVHAYIFLHRKHLTRLLDCKRAQWRWSHQICSFYASQWKRSLSTREREREIKSRSKLTWHELIR